MAHGTPDWGLVGPKATTYGLDDMGELAVRLGSPVAWDRRGDVIFADDLENGVAKATLYAPGVGAGAYLSCAHAWHGDLCVLLVARSDDDWLAYIQYQVPLPVQGYCATEVWFGMHEDVQDVELWIRTLGAEGQYAYGVEYHHVNKTLSWMHGLNMYTVFEAGVDIYNTERPFHVWKLVIDTLNHMYHRLILDDTTYDLSAFAGVALGGATPPWLATSFHVTSVDGENAEVFVDNFIVTQNEPG